MRQIGKFLLEIPAGRRKWIFKTNQSIVVEVLVDNEHTHIVIDCSCCKNLLKNSLPRGAMIAIVSALREFFTQHQMKKVHVSVTKHVMHREYEGVIDAADIDELERAVVESIAKFEKKKI